MPDSANSLLESYDYFRALGYMNIAFVPAAPSLWTKHSLSVFEQQFAALGNRIVDEFRNGQVVILKGIDDAIEGIIRQRRPKHACGAGRGLLLVDIHGDIWPCHRWNKGFERSWRIGSIYEQFDELVRADLDRPSQIELLQQDCARCPANLFCGGGCPAENLEETGYIYKRHDNACEYTRIWARVGQHVHDTLLSEANPTFLRHYYKQQASAA